MRLIGLTGGIASGKSTFAGALRALGVPVLDADAFAREAVSSTSAPGRATLSRVAEALGSDSLAADGSLDRKAVARRVFSDPAARARLESIIHPAVRSAVSAELARLAGAGHSLVFYDVPLLYEVGLQREVESVVVVWAPPREQIVRLRSREGLTEDEAVARLAAQLPIDEKAARADAVVLNDGPPEALPAKAAALLRDLRAGAGQRLPTAAPRRY